MLPSTSTSHALSVLLQGESFIPSHTVTHGRSPPCPLDHKGLDRVTERRPPSDTAQNQKLSTTYSGRTGNVIFPECCYRARWFPEEDFTSQRLLQLPFSYLNPTRWSHISPTSSKGSSQTLQPSGIPLSSALRQHPLSARPPPQGPRLPEGTGAGDQCGLFSQALCISALTSNSSLIKTKAHQ